MEKLRTREEVEKLTGFSRRSLQEIERKITGKPAHKNKYGYLRYSEQEIDVLWSIRFYRELGYGLDEIKQILEDPNYNRRNAVQNQITELEEKRDLLDAMINIARIYAETGINFTELRSTGSTLFRSAPFDLLMQSLNVFYSVMDTPEHDEDPDLFCDEDLEKLFPYLEKLYDSWQTGKKADEEEIQELILGCHDVLSPYVSHSVFFFSQFALALCADSDLTEELDEALGEGFSLFLHDAIQVYARKNENNATDYAIEKAFSILDRLSLQSSDPASGAAQNTIRVIDDSFAAYKLVSEKERMAYLCVMADKNQLSKLAKSNSERRQADFFSQAFQIYVKSHYPALTNKEDLKMKQKRELIATTNGQLACAIRVLKGSNIPQPYEVSMELIEDSETETHAQFTIAFLADEEDFATAERLFADLSPAFDEADEDEDETDDND